MEEKSIYQDIAARTGGDIYLGVVGPVRCGKSTFIKRFLEVGVLPNITDTYTAQRLRDELPQSAGGKTVMTTEPKFIPNEAIEVQFGEASCRIKMVDCVGFLIPGAVGNTEDGEIRMVHTPWAAEPIPFETAAQTGTEKVIRDHATIGIVMTCDGSIGEFPRDAYLKAEAKTVEELQRIHKPFVIVCNTATPQNPDSIALAQHMESVYRAPVALVDCRALDKEDVDNILQMALYEFPLREIVLSTPNWMSVLPDENGYLQTLKNAIGEKAAHLEKLSDAKNCFKDGEGFAPGRVTIGNIAPENGTVHLQATYPDEIYYRVLSDTTGVMLENEADIIQTIGRLAEVEKKYNHLAQAMEEVEEKGYGIVMPEMGELSLDEPEIVRHSGGYGVRLKATAPSIHMIRAQIQAEVSPIVGTEQQTEEIVKYLLNEFKEDPSSLWQTNLFGKSLHELINESLHQKLEHMPDEARSKLGETVARIINEGSGGLICILL